MNEIIKRAMEFEDFSQSMFSYLGYKITTYDKKQAIQPDLVVEDINGDKSLIECKIYRSSKPSFSLLSKACLQLIKLQEKTNIISKVLLVATTINDELKEQLEEKYETVILDSRNILYLIKESETLLKKYRIIMSDVSENIFSFSLEQEIDLESKIGKGEQHKQFHSDNSKSNLLSFFEQIEPGVDSFIDYEELCINVLKSLFEINLSGWKKQKKTDDNLHRYDLVCKINKGNEFWDFIMHDFSSRYIIFEFKNYTDKISQTQIYTTEKYLYKTALRNVAIIISRKGANENAIKASKGILRESGKLIINLNDEHLKNMLEMKELGSDPTDYLFELVDDFLIELGK